MNQRQQLEPMAASTHLHLLAVRQFALQTQELRAQEKFPAQMTQLAALPAAQIQLPQQVELALPKLHQASQPQIRRLFPAAPLRVRLPNFPYCQAAH